MLTVDHTSFGRERLSRRSYVKDLPAEMTEAERYAFAMRVMAVEHQHIKHAADIVHPVLDAFAQDYYAYLPQDLWPSVGVTAKRGREAVWHGDDPALRAQFREVARRFIDGDERLAIWRLRSGRG